MILELPFPPSTNTYWRSVSLPTKNGRGRRQVVLISEPGRKYRQSVINICSLIGTANVQAISGPLSITVNLYPPDLRKRDIDNYFKALFDALEHAGVYENDNQIKKLTAEMHNKSVGGKVVVEIAAL